MTAKSIAPRKDLFVSSFYTVKQVAEILQVSENAIYKWVDEGRIPYVDFGAEGHRRCLRFQPEALDKFIAEHSKN